MAEQFSQIWSFITARWQEIDQFLLPYGINLSALLLSISLILALLLLLRYALRIRKRETFSILLSKGEIRQSSEFDPLLSLRVSNLNAFPIQILELSIDSEAMTMPIVVDLAELVAANDSISIELELEQNVVGDDGLVYLFAYLPRQAKKLYRLKASYSYEPWAGRYKISPLKQEIKRVRQLDSQRLTKSLNEPLNAKYLERSSSNINALKTPKNETAINAEQLKSSARLSHTEILNHQPHKQTVESIKRPPRKAKVELPRAIEQAQNMVDANAETELRVVKPKPELKFPNEF